jgi:hypothetical protein
VEIECFVWTEHAQDRLRQRRLDAADVEQAIKGRHVEREVNDGRAEWLVSGETADGAAFEAIYDYPHGDDETAVRIVSVWRLDS